MVPILAVRLVSRNVALQLGQPGRGRGIGGHAPVPAGRQRASGHHLGAIGQRRAFELVGEEAAVEQLEPMADLGEPIGDPLCRRQPLGPVPGIGITPGLVREEGYVSG